MWMNLHAIHVDVVVLDRCVLNRGDLCVHTAMSIVCVSHMQETVGIVVAATGLCEWGSGTAMGDWCGKCLSFDTIL